MLLPLVLAATFFVTTSDGARIHCIEQRPAKAESDLTLVFIPGWMMPGAIWKQQLDAFGRTHRAVAIDPRSQGDSSKTTDGNFPARRAQDLREVILDRDLKRVVLVVATGSVVDVAAYVDRYGTDRIAAFVFVHGVAGADYDKDTLANLIRWAQRFQTDRAAQTESLVRSLIPKGDIAWLTREAMKMPTSSAIAAFVGSMSADFRSALPKIDKPALILVGESRWHDQYLAMQQAIPGARLHKIADTGHAPCLDAPAEFNAIVAELVATLR